MLRLLPARLSLRTRLTLGVMLIALASTVGVSAAAFLYVSDQALETISSDQMQRTVEIAEAIDQKFVYRRGLLKAFAQSLELQGLRGTAQLQPVLEKHTAVSARFDNITIFDVAGDAVANYNGDQAIGRVNIANRQYLMDTVTSGEGQISQPIRNRFSGAPQVVMTEVVRGALGQVMYVITAFITLNQPNFLGELADLKFGESGYVFIVNTDGIIIDSPHKERILGNFEADDELKRPVREAIQGFQGVTQGANETGMRTLYAFKRLRETNWIVGTNYPHREALAALKKVEIITVLGALLLTLLVGAVSMLLLRRELAPLTRLQQHMLKTHAAEKHVPFMGAFGDDEIGDLARTFDALMAERQAAQGRQNESRKRIEDLADKLRLITDNTPALISHLDSNERYTFVNKAVRDWWGWEPDAVLGRPIREVLGEDVYGHVAPMLQLALAGERQEYDLQSPVNGVTRFAHSVLVPEKDAGGVVIGVFILTIDTSELKAAERELAMQARVDSMTQLANRLAFKEEFPKMLARAKRSQDALVLMYLDIDHFKSINDTLGHAAGDEVLCEVARRLRACLRTTDLVVRLGGDEFVVVLEHVGDACMARTLAQKVVEQMARPVFEVAGTQLSMTTSIGVVFHPHTAAPTTADEVLGRADEALYLAKAEGRNRFELAS